jgi:hypothetical protein
MFRSKKKEPQIPFIQDLDQMFKHFNQNNVYDFTEKDFESLKPDDHAFALQMYFIRQFRNTINVYIEQEVENKLSKFKEKMEHDFEDKIDGMVDERISKKLDKQKKELEIMIESIKQMPPVAARPASPQKPN